MMKTIKSQSAVASVAKGKSFVACFLLLLAAIILIRMVQGADIFATPTPDNSIPYPTSAAFLAATKSGEIPELLLHTQVHNGRTEESEYKQQLDAFKRSLMQIMEKECGINIKDTSPNWKGSCYFTFVNIVAFELNKGRDQGKSAADWFQGNRKYVSGDISAKSFAAYDSFLKEYSKAVKEYAIKKQDQTEQHQATVEKDKQQADAVERQAEAEREQKAKQLKAAEDARKASIAAEEAVKAEAVKEARAAQQEDRAKKLGECLESPAYKIWQASLRVATGVKMIRDAQTLLAHDNAVARESDVSNLAERRKAGEDMVTGKILVEKSFAEYKKVGGTASTPEEVVPGPDPAAQYR